MNENDRECELKIRLDQHSFLHLLEELEGQSLPVEQVNIFFDTATPALETIKWALRIRSEANAYTMTLKGPCTQTTSGSLDRPEYEQRIAATQAESMLIGFDTKEIKGKIGVQIESLGVKGTFLPFLSFTNQRSIRKLDELNIELDELSFGKHTHYEMEIEHLPHQEHDIAERINHLLSKKGIPMCIEDENKIQKVLRWKDEDSHSGA